MKLAKTCGVLCTLQSTLRTPSTSDHSHMPLPYSRWMAESVMSRFQGLGLEENVTGPYEDGFLHLALQKILYFGNLRPAEVNHYYGYLSHGVENELTPLGDIRGFSLSDQYLDNAILGHGYLAMYETTHEPKYAKAAQTLRENLDTQPLNYKGGYWYKTETANQSYLDGMYMLSSYYTRWTGEFQADNASAVAADILHQFDLFWEHCLDQSTGLLYHGYDASKTAVWADPLTGASPEVWGRALAWFLMALVDTLDLMAAYSFPKEIWYALHEQFTSLSKSVLAAIDPPSGGWWQVMSKPGHEGNYIESSCTAMFVYSFYKGVRMGYLDDQSGDDGSGGIYTQAAGRAYNYLLDHFVVRESNGTLSYNGTVKVGGLITDGSFEYYTSQPINYNDLKGSSAFIIASLEHELWMTGGARNVSEFTKYTPFPTALG